MSKYKFYKKVRLVVMQKKIARRRFVAASGALGLTAIAGCIGEDAEPDDDDDDDDDEIGDPDPDGGEILEWDAGGQSGTYYPLSGDFKSIVESHTSHGLQVQSTGASVENVGRLERGESDFALIQNDVGYFAYNGVGIDEIDEEMTSLRAVGSLYPETIHIVADADADIESIEDLDGATVNVGDEGSGTEVNAQQILETAGVEADEQTGDFATAADQIRDGGIDAAVIVGGWPVGAVDELAETTDITLVEVPEDIRADLMEEAEWFSEDEIPGGTYDGADDDVQTVSVEAMIATHEDVDDEIVEEVTEAIFENTDDVTQKEEYIDAESAQDAIPIDFHPGAEAYFD
ncbi:hypothetical protein SAMN05421809_2776 [Natronorubrum daqingense]|uniref:C4-dicarboxylate ABC transporter substrate-binding protein n=2 Tax=Natronorubrum daqingense TaxID=588898 RepID=A0A1N7EQ07_9EURY|nr:hypothetical protein SAMN05421809_2776 [Natronorubrum daqingense]